MVSLCQWILWFFFLLSFYINYQHLLPSWHFLPISFLLLTIVLELMFSMQLAIQKWTHTHTININESKTFGIFCILKCLTTSCKQSIKCWIRWWLRSVFIIIVKSYVRLNGSFNGIKWIRCFMTFLMTNYFNQYRVKHTYILVPHG